MTIMHRRSFVLLATGSLATASLPAAASAGLLKANAPALAIVRIGQRIFASLPQDTLHSVLRVAASLPAAAGTELNTRISADYRAGRTIRLDGISLSVTEAAWCLSTVQDKALS